ncbi:MAG: flagellar hook protein FlgE [Pseudomonadota bacterium]
MPFRIALSGLNAASADLEVTANNLANVNTVGFKESRAEFEAVYSSSTQTTSSAAIGSGVRLDDVSQQFAQGNVDFTNNALDIAIGGEGFFVLSGDGAVTYTRAGNFRIDNEGYLVSPDTSRLQGYLPTTPGEFNGGQLSDLQITTGANPPAATTRTDFDVNVPAGAAQPSVTPFDPATPASYNHSTSITTYDSLGNPHTSTLYFVKEAAANAWTAHVTIDGNTVGAGQAITFDATGNLSTPAGGAFTLPAYDPANGASPINLNVDVAGTTQFGGSFAVNAISQDGSATGTLTGLEIDSDGILIARYTNGQSTALGKIAMSIFSNPQGLQQIDGAWAATVASGEPILGEANVGRFGNLTSGALEASNVDLTEQLVNMITAQRNFQANAQMISTADSTTQTIINIR